MNFTSFTTVLQLDFEEILEVANRVLIESTVRTRHQETRFLTSGCPVSYKRTKENYTGCTVSYKYLKKLSSLRAEFC